MKRILTILIVITLLLSLTACGKNDGNFPKDDGKRYANVVDAHYEEENCMRSEVIYEIEIDGFVSYCITTTGGGEVGTLYRDDKGYFYDKYFKSKKNTYNLNVDVCEIIHHGDKIFVIVDSLTLSQQNIPNVKDSINSNFIYAHGLHGIAYFYGYMTVLDEIPKDYAIIIDGVSYRINDYMSLETNAIILFTVFFTVIGSFVSMLIIRKIKKKKRNKLPKTLFK